MSNRLVLAILCLISCETSKGSNDCTSMTSVSTPIYRALRRLLPPSEVSNHRRRRMSPLDVNIQFFLFLHSTPKLIGLFSFKRSVERFDNYGRFIAFEQGVVKSRGLGHVARNKNIDPRSKLNSPPIGDPLCQIPSSRWPRVGQSTGRIVDPQYDIG